MRIRDHHWTIGILAGWFYLALVGLPASWWVEVQDIQPFSAPTPSEVTMTVGTVYHRVFRGLYTATIRRNPGREFVCSGPAAQGPHRFDPANAMPKPLYLWRVMGGKADLARCEEEGMGPGLYLIEVCVTVLQPFWGLVPDKSVCADSSGFIIEGKK